jgi:hypothetical protein
MLSIAVLTNRHGKCLVTMATKATAVLEVTMATDVTMLTLITKVSVVTTVMRTNMGA